MLKGKTYIVFGKPIMVSSHNLDPHLETFKLMKTIQQLLDLI